MRADIVVHRILQYIDGASAPVDKLQSEELPPQIEPAWGFLESFLVDDWESWKWSKEELESYESKKQSPPVIEVGRFLWRPNWADNILFPVVVKRTWVTESQDQGLFDSESAGGYWEYYGVVTNMSLYFHTKQNIIEHHNKRGNAENFIREEKYGYDLKHFPCLKLKANYAFGLLAMVAHNLLRWVAIVEKPDKPHFSKKLRRRFVFIPGKVVQHARSIIMKVPIQFFKEVNRLRRGWQLPLYPAPAWASGSHDHTHLCCQAITGLI